MADAGSAGGGGAAATAATAAGGGGAGSATGFALAHARSRVALLVHPRQAGNPVTRHVVHVRREVERAIAADFVCGPTTGVLFLSLQYHALHPRYIYARVRALGPRAFRLRVLLVLADAEAHAPAIRELSTLALIHDLALVCAPGPREAARYLETLRAYDARAPDVIQARAPDDYPGRLHAALTTVRGVNKTDVRTVAFSLGAFKDIAAADEDRLRLCPGFGDTKVARLYAAFNQPFKTSEEWEPGAENEEAAEL